MSTVPAAPKGRSSFVVTSIKNMFLLLLLLVLFVLLSLCYNNTMPGTMRHGVNLLDGLASRLGLQEHVYAAVVDAGSTGTRTLAFTFHRSIIDGSLKLDSEFFKEIKPGLSSYADSPDQAAAPLRELLAAARAVIPGAAVTSTPLLVRATAGLRLLAPERAAALLRVVRETTAQSGFHVAEDGVAIMSGTDEALFGWFTVNFLLDRLGGSAHSSVAVLDLGGGSAQVAFAPSQPETVAAAPAGTVVDVSALRADVGVYSRSYLGLGLMEARHGMLTGAAAHANSTTEHLISHCVNPIVKTQWKHGGRDYTVSGVAKDTNYRIVKGVGGLLDNTEPIVDFVTCYESAARFLSGRLHAPNELSSRQVYGVSYIFDRATEAGLIDPFKGGDITVEQLTRAARASCETPNVDQPMACLDLTYISALLHSGLRLPGEHKLHLRKQIDGHETSWALGAAFHTLTNRPPAAAPTA